MKLVLDNAVYIVGWIGIGIWVFIWVYLILKYVWDHVIKHKDTKHTHHNNISFH